MKTTLSAGCPTSVTITVIPDATPLEPGDVLSCNAEGHDLTYTWTGTVNGAAIIAQTGSTYTLLEGDFDLTCTATVDALMCTSAPTDSASGTALGNAKYLIMLL